jgi:murein DD-endopeptidase MepM/ murein hydrolase activator NlpD
VIRAKIRKIPETAISLWDFCSEKTRYFGGKRVNLRIQKSFRHMHSTKFKTRKRFRLTFVNENTFNAVWTLRLSQAKVWALTVLVVAAIAALVACILVATPISKLLPGYLDAAQRRDHVVNTMRVDSLATEAAEHRAYIDNIIKILEGTDADSAAVVAATAADEAKVVTDTLMPASERERKYVAQWNDRERYNLSVLTPIAAEGMTFSAPTAMARPDTLLELAGAKQLRFHTTRYATVVAIHSGTVVDTHVAADGSGEVVMVQHANDFLSRYGGISSLFVAPGDKLCPGQALGIAGATGRLTFELWHNGNAVNPLDVIPF